MKQSLEVNTLKSELFGKIKILPDVFNFKYPSLRQLEILDNTAFVVAYLNKWIYDTISFFNIGRNMNDTQIMDTSFILFEKFPNLTMAEIYFVFKEAKGFKYGQLYDRLDGQIILGWFDRFWNDRLQAAEDISFQEHNRLKERTGDSYTQSQNDNEHSLRLKMFADRFRDKSK